MTKGGRETRIPLRHGGRVSGSVWVAPRRAVILSAARANFFRGRRDQTIWVRARPQSLR